MFGRKSVQPWFFESSVHTESLNRMLYLVESNARFGLLYGQDGTGRSHLLRQLQDELQRQHIPAVWLNAAAMDSDALLQHVAESLAIRTRAGSRRSELMLKIREEFLGRAHCRVQTVVLIDDLHRAAADVSPAVQFLSAVGSQAEGLVSVMASSNRPSFGSMSDSAALSICLTRLSVTESIEFILDLLHLQGVPSTQIDPTAIAAIAELCGGLPARLVRICDLLKIVQTTSPELHIDDRIVHQFVREVTPRAVA